MIVILRRLGLSASYIISLLLIGWSLPAMMVGIFHIGSLLPFGLGIVCLLAVIKRKWIAQLTGTARVLLRIVAAGMICFCLAFIIASGFMIHAAGTQGASEATVIVAGAQVHGSIPSLSLQRRLDAAVQYLNEHPDAPCVVSGGQGEGEDLPEAEVMAGYLIERGIDDSRIFVENRSKNTSQNMLYSAELIEREKLPRQVAVVTDAFHQLRCQMFAKKNGLSPGAVVSETPWYLQQCYWWREIFGLAKAIVLGS